MTPIIFFSYLYAILFQYSKSPHLRVYVACNILMFKHDTAIYAAVDEHCDEQIKREAFII